VLWCNVYRRIDLLEAIRRLKGFQRHSNRTHQNIIQVWLQVFQLTPEMVDLSPAEIQQLDDYLYANRLLIDCERAAVRRSPAVWSQIESRMLRVV
jgi:hypothetical protein